MTASGNRPPHPIGPPPGGYRSVNIPVVRREDFSDRTYLLELEHPMLARAARPGQFVIVMAHEDGERIPLTIADFDRERGTLTLVVQAVGKTTLQMQQECREGATLASVTGPMGEPSRIRGGGKVICVGGGLGVAPVFPQARAFRDAGAFVIGIVGFRSQGLAFWRDRFESVCDEFVLCTDDGSAGIEGRVTVGLERTLARHPDVREVVAIGPPVMMQACAEITRPAGIRTTVSLNPIMVDGTGMCGGCRVRLRSGMKFACVDGPDFDGHEVDFEDLIVRLNRFVKEERQAVVKWSETCKMAKAP
ncbi:MAG: sulfide/dihydroorotate dehydrogenase-like FAD/NAD-binding protein [Xanthomonadales bacterium]